MQRTFKHLPFALVALILTVLGLTNRAVDADLRVWVTLLAPILWLGLYLLFGSDRAANKE